MNITLFIKDLFLKCKRFHQFDHIEQLCSSLILKFQQFTQRHENVLRHEGKLDNLKSFEADS